MPTVQLSCQNNSHVDELMKAIKMYRQNLDELGAKIQSERGEHCQKLMQALQFYADSGAYRPLFSRLNRLISDYMLAGKLQTNADKMEQQLNDAAYQEVVKTWSAAQQGAVAAPPLALPAPASPAPASPAPASPAPQTVVREGGVYPFSTGTTRASPTPASPAPQTVVREGGVYPFSTGTTRASPAPALPFSRTAVRQGGVYPFSTGTTRASPAPALPFSRTAVREGGVYPFSTATAPEQKKRKFEPAPAIELPSYFQASGSAPAAAPSSFLTVKQEDKEPPPQPVLSKQEAKEQQRLASMALTAARLRTQEATQAENQENERKKQLREKIKVDLEAINQFTQKLASLNGDLVFFKDHKTVTNELKKKIMEIETDRNFKTLTAYEAEGVLTDKERTELAGLKQVKGLAGGSKKQQKRVKKAMKRYGCRCNALYQNMMKKLMHSRQQYLNLLKEIHYHSIMLTGGASPITQKCASMLHDEKIYAGRRTLQDAQDWAELARNIKGGGCGYMLDACGRCVTSCN